MIEPPLKSSPNDKALPSLIRGPVYLLKSTHIILWYFGKLCNLRYYCSATTAHLPRGFTPTTHMSNQKKSNDRCLGYVPFSVVQIFGSIGNSFVTMVIFWMTLLMNKFTDTVMEDGWVHPLAKTLPPLVTNLWWNIVMDDWNLDEKHLVSESNFSTINT